MYINIEEPTSKISKDVIKVWRMTNSIFHLFGILLIAILIVCGKIFGWPEWLSTLFYILGCLDLVSSIFYIIIEPVYLQRTWRYQIDDKFVQLKHGRLQEKHTLIPMEKVEYVRTEQGPLMRHYNLYNIEIGTTTSGHVIPAIPAEEAIQLKGQIAIYAKIRDKDSIESVGTYD